MKLSLLFLIFLGTSIFAATEERINKQYVVQPGGKLVVDVAFGSLEVAGGEGNAVTVEVWRKVSRGSKSGEEGFLRENPVEFSQDGPNVRIRSRGKSSRGWGSWFGGGNRTEAKYSIRVPAKYNGDLKTAGGSVTVENLSGDTRAETSGGALRFTGLQGNSFGETSGGSIRVSNCEGDLKVHTSGGSIDISGGSGSLDAGTSGGSIGLKNFKGPARVETSGGGISIESHSGELKGSTSGGSIHAMLLAPIGESTKLTTSGGGITVCLPENAAFDLDAETSGGSVHSDFAIPGEKNKRSHLQAAVNGGGKSVFLRTTGGSIQVKKL